MPRVNRTALEREEAAIEDDDTMTPKEKARALRQLHLDVREEYEEQQRDEMRNEFGW